MKTVSLVYIKKDGREGTDYFETVVDAKEGVAALPKGTKSAYIVEIVSASEARNGIRIIPVEIKQDEDKEPKKRKIKLVDTPIETKLSSDNKGQLAITQCIRARQKNNDIIPNPLATVEKLSENNPIVEKQLFESKNVSDNVVLSKIDEFAELAYLRGKQARQKRKPRKCPFLQQTYKDLFFKGYDEG